MIFPVFLFTLFRAVHNFLASALELKLLDLSTELTSLLVNTCSGSGFVDPLIFLQLDYKHIGTGRYLNIANNLLRVDLLARSLQRVGDSRIP